MLVNPKYQKPAGNTNRYLVNEIMGASQEELILKVYDFAIANSKLKNLEKTNKAIQVLIDSLSFATEESSKMSVELLRIYQFCQDQARKQNFSMVETMLTDLRDTWIQVFENNKNKG